MTGRPWDHFCRTIIYNHFLCISFRCWWLGPLAGLGIIFVGLCYLQPFSVYFHLYAGGWGDWQAEDHFYRTQFFIFIFY